ncbi:MAG TPA: hypothetical protein VFW02_08255 [Candidatus Limnocylindrales bacterium]|nr:hypothetical protein [Candidatus Limnocylindrales bacterium]
MLERRWLRWLGPGVIALGALGSIASTAFGAGQRPWATRACGDDGGARASAARWAAPIGLGDLHLEPWFRMDPRLDRAGALQGQRLALGIDGDRSSRIMDLPRESFAAGPFGRTILVGADDGSASRLELVNVAGECSSTAAQESDVIRRATVDPSGTTIYEMRVDRVTRADLGIWARPLDGSAPAVRVLEPIGVDDRFGPTFATEFSWELSGSSLAIQSCGEEACRTRVFEPATGALQVLAEPDLGGLVGLEGDVLVSYAACPGLPCPIVGTDLTTGARTVLADAGAAAVIVTTTDGPRLVHEVAAESGFKLHAVALDGSAAADVGTILTGVRLQPAAPAATSGTRIPIGWVLLGPDGRIPDNGPGDQTQLRHVPDGTTVQLDEVAQ